LDHFNLIAPIYEYLIHPDRPDRLISYADLPVVGLLLDAGGGTGSIAQAVSGLVTRAIVVDLSFNMLRQGIIKKNIIAVCSNAESLPFENAIFERIFMVDAFHHLNDQKFTLRELWRVLKPGGKLIIQEPDIRNVYVKLVALMEKILLMHSHFLTPESIAGLLKLYSTNIRVEVDKYTTWIIAEK